MTYIYTDDQSNPRMNAGRPNINVNSHLHHQMHSFQNNFNNPQPNLPNQNQSPQLTQAGQQYSVVSNPAIFMNRPNNIQTGNIAFNNGQFVDQIYCIDPKNNRSNVNSAFNNLYASHNIFMGNIQNDAQSLINHANNIVGHSNYENGSNNNYGNCFLDNQSNLKNSFNMIQNLNDMHVPGNVINDISMICSGNNMNYNYGLGNNIGMNLPMYQSQIPSTFCHNHTVPAPANIQSIQQNNSLNRISQNNNAFLFNNLNNMNYHGQYNIPSRSPNNPHSNSPLSEQNYSPHSKSVSNSQQTKITSINTQNSLESLISPSSPQNNNITANIKSNTQNQKHNESHNDSHSTNPNSAHNRSHSKSSSNNCSNSGNSNGCNGGSNSGGGKQADELRVAIRHFVNFIEESIIKTHQITSLSRRFSIKRRRFYDIINVLESIGCCRKNALDSIEWFGTGNIALSIERMKNERQVFNPSFTLDQLFPVPCCVGITNLTASFIMLFFALQTDKLDLRYASQFLSRETTRYKTTLCKLYHITYILCALNVMERTNQVCEIILSSPFYNKDDVAQAVANSKIENFQRSDTGFFPYNSQANIHDYNISMNSANSNCTNTENNVEPNEYKLPDNHENPCKRENSECSEINGNSEIPINRLEKSCADLNLNFNCEREKEPNENMKKSPFSLSFLLNRSEDENKNCGENNNDSNEYIEKSREIERKNNMKESEIEERNYEQYRKDDFIEERRNEFSKFYF